MKKNLKKVEKKLEEFTRKLSLYVSGKPDFFLCWENTDRERDEEEYYLDEVNGDFSNVPAYFKISIPDYDSRMGDIDLSFIYDRKTKRIKLVAEHYEYDPYVLYEHDNLDEMRNEDVCNLLISFKQIAPLYEELIKIMRLEEQKKPHYEKMYNIYKQIFKIED